VVGWEAVSRCHAYGLEGNGCIVSMVLALVHPETLFLSSFCLFALAGDYGDLVIWRLGGMPLSLSAFACFDSGALRNGYGVRVLNFDLFCFFLSLWLG
jgi:hypothetical protein